MLDNSNRKNYAAFNLPAGLFTSILKQVGCIIPSRSDMPILENVLFEFDTERNAATFTGSNGDAVFCTAAPNGNTTDEGLDGLSFREIKADGKLTDQLTPVCLPYRQLMSVLSVMPAGIQLHCVIDYDKQEFTVCYGSDSNVFTMSFEPAKEYPRIGAGETFNCRFKVSAKWLMPQIERAKICIANDDLRPVMNNIYLDLQTDHLALAASNSKILYTDRTFLGAGYCDQTGAETPRKGIFLHRSAVSLLPFPADDRDITIEANDKFVRLSDDESVIILRQTEGNFPNYTAVIPRNQPHLAYFQRHTLIQALRRVRTFVNPSTLLVKMEHKGDMVMLTGQDIDYNRALQEAVPYDGQCTLPEGFAIGFNVETLISVLEKCVTSDVILMRFVDGTKAVTIHSDDANDASVALVMPMMLSAE